MPKSIASDNGKQFVSNTSIDFCKINSIKIILSTPYHSRNNGMAERAIKTIKDIWGN